MVTGCLRCTPFFMVSHLNISGGIRYDMSTTENMPMMVTSANECKAGCLDTISVPMPTNMMRADCRMLTLYEPSIGRRYVYSCWHPSVMKMV